MRVVTRVRHGAFDVVARLQAEDLEEPGHGVIEGKSCIVDWAVNVADIVAHAETTSGDLSERDENIRRRPHPADPTPAS